MTDHSCRGDDPWVAPEDRVGRAVHAGNAAVLIGPLRSELPVYLTRLDLEERIAA